MLKTSLNIFCSLQSKYILFQECFDTFTGGKKKQDRNSD